MCVYVYVCVYTYVYMSSFSGMCAGLYTCCVCMLVETTGQLQVSLMRHHLEAGSLVFLKLTNWVKQTGQGGPRDVLVSSSPEWDCKYVTMHIYTYMHECVYTYILYVYVHIHTYRNICIYILAFICAHIYI